MTNLLPQTEQQAIVKEYAHRRMVVVLVMCAVTIAICAIFLLPSYILSEVKLTEMMNAAQAARTTSTELLQTKNSATVLLKETNRKVQFLKVPKEGEKSVYAVIDMIVKQKTANIRIQSFLYTAATETAQGSVVLNGLAKDRESLTTFLKNMEAQPAFTTVDLPVSNFAKDKDIVFSMQIYGNF